MSKAAAPTAIFSCTINKTVFLLCSLSDYINTPRLSVLRCSQKTETMATDANAEINVEEITCPITMDIFHDPVRLNDGYVYEYKAILRWCILDGKSPITRQTLTTRNLKRDYRLKELAARYRASMASCNVLVERLPLPAFTIGANILTKSPRNTWLIDRTTLRRQRRARILQIIRWSAAILLLLFLLIVPNVCIPLCLKDKN